MNRFRILEFTPLEFETDKKQGIIYDVKTLEFTPLEFETLEWTKAF